MLKQGKTARAAVVRFFRRPGNACVCSWKGASRVGLHTVARVPGEAVFGKADSKKHLDGKKLKPVVLQKSTKCKGRGGATGFPKPYQRLRTPFPIPVPGALSPPPAPAAALWESLGPLVPKRLTRPGSSTANGLLLPGLSSVSLRDAHELSGLFSGGHGVARKG